MVAHGENEFSYFGHPVGLCYRVRIPEVLTNTVLDDDDIVDVARRLSTAATNGPIVHHPGDM
jgi:hypothetical protein